MNCDKCDNEFGGKKLYSNQHIMPLNGKVRSIDPCIAHIVAALNAGGVETVACCCGHNKLDGRIDLADGRVLWIKQSTSLEGELMNFEKLEEVIASIPEEQRQLLAPYFEQVADKGQALTDALVGLLGTDDIEELNAMEALLRSTDDVPKADIAVSINAIHALKAVL